MAKPLAGLFMPENNAPNEKNSRVTYRTSTIITSGYTYGWRSFNLWPPLVSYALMSTVLLNPIRIIKE